MAGDLGVDYEERKVGCGGGGVYWQSETPPPPDPEMEWENAQQFAGSSLSRQVRPGQAGLGPLGWQVEPGFSCRLDQA